MTTAEQTGYGPRAALSAHDIAELTRRARGIMREHPPLRGWPGPAQRGNRLCALAAEYAINVRTLYRYLHFGEPVTVRVGEWEATFAIRDNRAPTQVTGWLCDEDDGTEPEEVPA